MTVALVETTAAGGTVPFSPTFKGRAQVSWANNCGSKGTVIASPEYGAQTVGFVDDGAVDQFASAIGMAIQFPFFEASNSAGINDGFNLGGPGHGSINTDVLSVDDFGCGDVDYVSGSVHGTDIVAALILSGNTLETKAGVIPGQPTSGHVSVTGLGFRPELVLFSWWGTGRFNVDAIDNTGKFSFGAYDGTNQWSAGGVSGVYLTSGADRASRFSASAVSTAPGFPDVQAVSLDADGFTVNYVGSRGFVIWEAFADTNGQFACGTGVEGDTSIPVGFAAEAVMMGTAGVTSLDTDVSGCSLGIGGSDSQLNQLAGWGASSSLSTSGNRRYMNDSVFATSKAGLAVPIPPINSAEAVATAFNPTTVDLNWTVGGSGGVRFGWVGFRCSSAAGYEGCGGTPQQIYRWLKR